MRTLSGTLAAELGLTITRPGYLVEIGFSSVLRLSTLGDVSYGGYVWSAADIKVAGLGRNEQGGNGGQLSLGNADLDYGALILNEGAADRPVRIWSVWAGAPAEAMLEFDGIGDDAEIGTRVVIRLIQDARRYTYSPRRFINAATGFATLLPAGTKIAIGQQSYILDRA